MPGHGPRDAKLVVIGEAPGRQEDQAGRPFVGQAGELLRSLLAEAGIDADDAFITNSVSCRPPGNRPPTRAELKACRPYLQTELAEINPEYVLLLGNTALSYLGKTGITKLRGQPIQGSDGSTTYLATFHPAAALRDPGRLPAIKQDLRTLASLMAGKQLPKVEDFTYRSVTDRVSERELLEKLVGCTAFSFDLETTSLHHFLPDERINCVGFCIDGEECWVVPASYDYFRRVITRAVALTKEKKAIAHNGKFDQNWLLAKLGVRFNLRFDTYLAAHLLDENRELNLKTLARTLCGAPDYDLSTKEKKGDVEPDKLYRYNAMDCYYTFKLYEFFKSQLQKLPSLRKLFYNLTMPIARLYEEIEQGGLYVDQVKFKAVEKDLQVSHVALEKELQRLSGSRRKINWNSPKQVGELLYGKLKLPALYRTPTGAPATGESALVELQDHHPIVGKLLEYRGVQKMLSTYVEGWKPLMYRDRVYMSTNLAGTVTGRFSSRLHQVPRNGIIRNVVTAPEGWTFVAADFCLTGDTEILTIDGAKPIRDLVTNPVPVLSWGKRNITGKEDFKNRHGTVLEFKSVIKAACVGIAQVYRLYFEDGTSVKCTAEHKWLAKNLDWVKTGDLKEGDRLAHVYTCYANGYPMWSLDSFQRRSADVVAEFSLGKKPKGFHTDHINRNRKDWSRKNLRYLPARVNKAQGGQRYWKEIKENKRSDNYRLSRLRYALKYVRRGYVGENNPNFGKRKGKVVECTLCGKSFYTYIRKFCSVEHYQEFRKQNHRIVKIVKCKSEPVYQITVEDNHNYVLANGLISANSQIELRLIAEMSDDPQMKMVFQTGGDIHIKTAQEVMGITEEPTKDDRRKAKGVNFGLVFGMSANKFQIYAKQEYGVNFTRSESYHYRERYFQVYAKVLKYHAKQRALVRTQGYVTNLLGRMRRLPTIYSPEPDVQNEAERQAINSPIQSFGSGDLKALAMLAIREHCPPDQVRLKGEVHDSILMEVRTDALEQWLPVIKQLMENPPALREIFGVELTVPIVVDIEFGPWGAGAKYVV